jgi:glutamate-1-semialdehyde 2,1-aminomutase
MAQAMPGGVLGTFVTPEDQPLVIERGAGARVYDTAGREYVDWVLGSGPLVLGHAHPDVVAAIEEQARRGTQFYAMNTRALELAERIIDSVPCAQRVKFTSTGAEATFQALRLARAFTGREKILRFAGAYHGHHDYSMVGSSAGIPDAVAGLVAVAAFNDPQSVADAFDSFGAEIAAVIVEPVQRIVPPRPGFLESLRELCDRAGALLVFDEVVTGFRLARGGAQARYGVTPDLATFGKVIGGGLPLAAVAGRADVLELANPRKQDDRYVYFSGTLNGNPLSAAAGLATLNVLDREDGYERLNELGATLRDRLEEVAASSLVPLQISGDGAMAGLIFAEGDPLDPATVAGADKAALRTLERELLQRGILVNLAAKFYVSVAHTPGDIDLTCDAVAASLQALAESIVASG